MSKRSLIVTVGLLAGMLIPAGLALAAAGPPSLGSALPLLGSARVPDGTSYVCGHGAWKYVAHNTMVLRNDTFTDTTAPTRHNLGGVGDFECLFNSRDGSNFRITREVQATFAWNAYPELFTGCWYTICTQHTKLPLRVEYIHRLRVWWWDRYPRSMLGNEATDFWFTRYSPHRGGRDYGHHPDGAELMIWLDWNGIPGPSIGQHGFLYNGYYWGIGEHRTWITVNGVTTYWNYIQMRRLGVPTYSHGLRVNRQPSLTNYNLMPILKYCIRQGWIRRAWWASAFAAGNEVIRGGTGVHLLLYQLRVDGGLAG